MGTDERVLELAEAWWHRAEKHSGNTSALSLYGFESPLPGLRVAFELVSQGSGAFGAAALG